MPAPKGQKIAPGISEAELAAEKERLAREKWLVVVSDNGDELRGAPSNLRSNQGFMLECLAMKDQALAAMNHLMPALSENQAFLRAARRTIADRYRSLRAIEKDDQKYQTLPNCGSMNIALEDGFTRLLEADYVISQADQDIKLKDYSSLPETGAFYVGPIWQQKIASEAPEAFGLQKKCNAGVLVVALSYLWAGADAPDDPQNQQLHEVASFLRFLKGCFEYRHFRVVLFWDWASTMQGNPERTEAQNDMLLDGDLWFTHPSILTLQNKRLPEGRKESWSYERSGWPMYEDGVGRLVKPREKVLDLQVVLNWLSSEDADADYHPDPKQQKPPFSDAEGLPVKKRNSFAAMVAACVPLDRRRLPLAPKQFGSRTKRAHFGRESDRKLVQKKYADAFLSTLGRAKQLTHFEKMGKATDEEAFEARNHEWRAFVEHALPRCKGGLVELSFAGNDELLIDLAEILKVLPPTLEVLRLNRTACFGDGTKQEWKHLTRLELVDVERSGVKGTMEDIQHAIFKSRQGVVEDPKPCEVVTTLRLSHLCKACALCCANRCCRFFWLCYLYPSGHTSRVLEESELVVNTGSAEFEASMM